MGTLTMKKIFILVFLLNSIIILPNKVEAFSNVFPTVVPNRVVRPYDGIYDFRDFIKRDAEDVYFGEDYPCEMNVVPNLITMKRVLLSNPMVQKRNDARNKWKFAEWARQLNDLERFLSFCNRRNSVSKIRLF